MRVLLQRVKSAKVNVDGKTIGQIGHGLLLYLGCGKGDGIDQVSYLVEKVCRLRVFPDEADKMNLSLLDVNGEMLIISQFTLYGNCQKGRRPSFENALPPAEAMELYKLFIEKCKALVGVDKVQKGEFGAMMEVESINLGPINFNLDST